MVERDLAEGRLVRVAASEFGPQGNTFVRAYLAYRMDQPLGPAARAFREALLRRADGSATLSASAAPTRARASMCSSKSFSNRSPSAISAASVAVMDRS